MQQQQQMYMFFGPLENNCFMNDNLIIYIKV